MFQQLYHSIIEFFQLLAESQQAQPIVIPVRSQPIQRQPRTRKT